MKKTIPFFLSAVILISCFLLAHTADAGLIIERVRTVAAPGQKDISEKQVSYFQDNKVKTVSQDGTYAILDLQKGTMTMVNPSKKEYQVTLLKDMLKRMETGMNQLKKKFNALPPEQRAMVEQMMGVKRSQTAQLKLKETGKTTKIAGYASREFVILKNGRPLAEYWVSDALKKDILKEIDKSKMDKFEQAMKKISTEGLPFANSEADDMMKLEQKVHEAGEVVKEVHHAGQEVSIPGDSFRVVSVRKAAISASEFEIPKGYKKTAAPMEKMAPLANH